METLNIYGMGTIIKTARTPNSPMVVLGTRMMFDRMWYQVKAVNPKNTNQMSAGEFAIEAHDPNNPVSKW